MGNVLYDRIQGVSLTKTERKIADYFLKNYEDVGRTSSAELAKQIGVSDASIIRFSRTIGYNGFLELKNDVYRDLVKEASHTANRRSLTERFKKVPWDGVPSDVSQLFLDSVHNNIEQTFRGNALQNYIAITELLLSSRSKYIVGLRGCSGIAAQFARLLQFFASRVIEVSTTDSDSLGYLMDIEEGDLFLMFVLSRYYKADMPLIQVAHERKAKICIITDSMLAPMAPFADIMLIAKTSCLSFFHSTVGMNMLAEYLLTLASRKDWEHTKGQIEKRDKYFESYIL